MTEELAIADLEHVQENHHTIQWEETLHGAGPWQGTEAGCGGGPVCTPAKEHFNQKWGLKLLGCLMTGDSKGRALPLTSNVY